MTNEYAIRITIYYSRPILYLRRIFVIVDKSKITKKKEGSHTNNFLQN